MPKKEKEEESEEDDESEEEDEEESEEEDSDDEDSDDEMKDNNKIKNIKKEFKHPSISTLFTDYLQDDIINLKPNYQRDLTWDFKKMIAFIESIVKGFVIPLFILYKYQEDEKKDIINEDTEYECMDGQHRLTVLKHFMNSKLITVANKSDYIYFIDPNDEKKKRKVFYNLTQEIKNKYKNNIREMTKEERKAFRRTELPFVIIETFLPDTYKCDIFSRLQTGEKVNAITKVKNCYHPLTTFLRNKNIIGEQIINEWNDIIKINTGKIATCRLLNNKLAGEYTFLLLRLFLIADKKNLKTNYLNLNIYKYFLNDAPCVKIESDIEELYKKILKIKKELKIILKQPIIPELFMVLFSIKITEPELFKNLNTHLSLILQNYNTIDKYKENKKDKIICKDTMEKNSKEIIIILKKQKETLDDSNSDEEIFFKNTKKKKKSQKELTNEKIVSDTNIQNITIKKKKLKEEPSIQNIIIKSNSFNENSDDSNSSNDELDKNIKNYVNKR